MHDASNATFLCELSSGSLRTLVVYKPRSGEAPLWDFPDGTLCRRELAAYLVSRASGWDFVPPTVMRDGPMGEGAVQLFIESEPGEHYLTLATGREDVFRRVAAFDVVINNADRKSGHCLLERFGERIWVVDHGVAFHAQPKLRTVIWDFAGEALPEDVLDGLLRLETSLRSADGFRVEISTLLDGSEIDALEDRLAALLHRGRFPEPGASRPYPWPPI